MRRHRASALVVAAAVMVAAGGCGSKETPTSSAATTVPPTTAAPATVKPSGSISFVDVASGKVLGDPTGLPVYALETDVAGIGACITDCAKKWPPVPASKASVAPGIDQAKVGEITRGDGITQLTYDGKPLYTFVGDNPGVATCQGGEGKWWLLNADGTLNKKPA